MFKIINTKFIAKIFCSTMIVLVFLSSSFVSSTVYGAINKQINYQGKLTDSLGELVANGDYEIEFTLYTQLAGGSPIWTETHSGVNEVEVTNGLFSVMLGSITSLDSINFNQTLYLGVEVEGDGEMSPRKIIGAVPAAFVADTLDNLSSEQFLRTDAQNATSSSSVFLNVLQTGAGKVAEFFGQASATVLSILSDGNVGIGTTTPGTLLSLGNTGNNTINISATATSTFGSGINLRTGCFAVNGTCISGGGGSSASSTLLTDNNTFTGQNTITYASTTALTVSGNSYLGTVSSGTWNGTVIGDAYLTKSGDWTGTIDGNNFAGGAIGTGELLYGSSAGAISELAVSTNGFVLALSNGIPTWVATTTFSGGLTYSNGNVTADLGTAIDTTEITDNTILAVDLNVDNSPEDGDILVYDSTGGNFVWRTCEEVTGAPSLCDGDDAAGAGGSSGGTWSTTTSQVSGQFINYPNNTTDVVAIGSSATTSAEFWFDPNNGRSFITYASTTALTVSGNSYLGTISSGTWNGTVIGDAYLTKSGDWTGTIDGNNFAGGAIGTGELLYGSSAGAISELAVSTNGFVLALSNGIPTWVATTTLSTISGSINLATQVTGDLAFSNLTQGSALSVLGVTGNSTADVASIAAGSDHQVLRRSGTSVGFGAIDLSQSAAITNVLPVSNGGTGQSSFGQGWLGSNGSTITSSTSPTVNYVVATSSTVASIFPYASTTALTVSGNSYLGTISSGTWNGTVIGDAYLTKSGDWTGTFDGIEGSAYLDARNLTNFGVPFYDFLSATNTDALAQGATNLYYSNSLVNSYIHSSTTIPKTYTGNVFTSLQQFNANASTTILSVSETGTATTTILSNATSTFGAGVSASYLNITGASASSTFANGINLSAGCFAINGTCVGGSGGGSSQWVTAGSDIYYNTGNVGIGTTSPYAKLSVVGPVVAEYFHATSTTATSTIAGGLNLGSGGLVYDFSSGVTSIGAIETGNLSFDENAGIVSWIDMSVTSSASNGTPQGYSAFLDGNAALTVYGTSNGSGGVSMYNVGVATTSPWRQFAVSGTFGLSSSLTTAGATQDALCINSSTFEVTRNSGAASCTVSSNRFKSEILGLDTGLDSILALKPSMYKYNGTDEQRVGLIAEEVVAVDPRLIFYEDDGITPRGVRYEDIVPVLIKAVQEQQVQIDALASSTPLLEVSKVTNNNIVSSISEVTSDMFDQIVDLLKTATVKIAKLFVDEIHITDKLCVDDVCLDKDQLKALIIDSGGVDGSEKENESENNNGNSGNNNNSQNDGSDENNDSATTTDNVNATSTNNVVVEDQDDDAASSTPETTETNNGDANDESTGEVPVDEGGVTEGENSVEDPEPDPTPDPEPEESEEESSEPVTPTI